ncbi:MAG: CoA-binding protein [Acidobacteriota bacterium]
MAINDPEAIRRILETTRTIAVIGLSSDPRRPSYDVSRFMQSKGYRIIPVNPFETQVLNEKAYATLVDVPYEIDLVNIFRRSQEAGQFVDQAITLGIKAVWMQDGVIDTAAAKRAVDEGLDVVMDDCILRQYIRRMR